MRASDILLVVVTIQALQSTSTVFTYLSTQLTGYNDATTKEDCVNTIMASTPDDSLSCSMITPYLKCLIKVTGIYKHDAYSSTNSNAFWSLENGIENTARSAGLNCNFDIKGLSAEVAREQNYRNSGN